MMSGIISCLLSSGIETTLSPILNMSLMGLIEWVAVSTIIVSIIAIASLIVSVKTSRRQYKIDSANFVTEHVDGLLEKCKGSVNELHARKKDSTIKFSDEHEVKVLLGRLENIIYYINTDTLEEKIVLVRIRTILKLLRDDDEVKKIIRNIQKDFPTALVAIVRYMRYNI